MLNNRKKELSGTFILIILVLFVFVFLILTSSNPANAQVSQGTSGSNSSDQGTSNGTSSESLGRRDGVRTNLLESHSASDINTRLGFGRFSLQDIIDGNLKPENAWNESMHTQSHLAKDIKVKLGRQYYSLQDVITYNLLSGSLSSNVSNVIGSAIVSGGTREIRSRDDDNRRVISNFKTPNANAEDYTKICSGNNKFVSYNKEISTRSEPILGETYRFTCSYGKDDKTNKDIVLSNQFQTIASGEEKHVLRIGVGGRQKYKGTDSYEWQIALIDGKLMLRVINTETNKCPVYDVKNGPLDKETIYVFKGIECKMKEQKNDVLLSPSDDSESIIVEDPTDVNLDDLTWKDRDHKKFHEASEILVEWNNRTRTLQNLIDNGLINFPFFDGTLMKFEIPAGNKNEYNKYCSYENKPVRNVLNNYGLSRDAQYVELKNKIDVPNSIVPGGIYDFTCYYGEEKIASNKKIVLSENFSVIGKFKEPHINRIIRIANDFEYSNSEDTFSYMVALQEGKIVVRIGRPQNCRDIILDNIPICFPEYRQGVTVNPVRPSQRCQRWACPTNKPSCSYVESIGCISWTDNDISGIECLPEEFNIDLPETFCKINQCPVYDAKFGLLQKRTIYAWKGLKCSIKPGV
ncbi:MAG: hypothetical protein QXI33_01050 [Candidatus Pacearchaeota archaeon]